MKTIVLASGNENKILEIKSLLGPFGVNIKTSKELGLSEPIEDGKTFAENSLIKAKAAFSKTHLPSLADDSGFCIDGLNGFPGLASNRFAKAAGNYENACHILNECLNENNKKAYFICCISFIYEKSNEIIEKTFTGTFEGEFVYPGRGKNGFAYCPYFLPNGYSQTFSQMPDELRTKINHRAIALNKFLEFFKTFISEK
ncbi:MAG: dITP/XTP pyrophosphatase [Eubacteriales bacterium SKADARSKE-1]|nr:dITP/XTP pyrophosphatase [Eubacteriales bacterium SKADARSKE-1]